MNYRTQGKSEWEKDRPKFATLSDEFYVLKIVEVKPEELKQKYQAASGVMEKQVQVVFEVVSMKDGSPAVDNEGNDATGRKIWFTARPESMGFKEKGTVPSITRQLVYYVMNKDPFSDEGFEFNFFDFQGETIVAFVVEKPNQKGDMTNKIDRFIKPTKRVNLSEDTVDVKDIPF